MKERTTIIINDFFQSNLELLSIKKQLEYAIELLKQSARNKHTIFVCGNGGSSADSEHIAGELLKSFCLKRKINDNLFRKLSSIENCNAKELANNLQEGIKCIPLTSFNAFNTAFENDCDGSYKFAQLLNTLGEKDDTLIAISTSGNSKNVLYASYIAKAKGIKIIALTGETGGKLKQVADVLINAPSATTYKIQEYHLPIYHLLCLALESEMFEE